MVKKGKPATVIVARLALWEWGLGNGFLNLHSHNCLYSKDKEGNRIRLNFRDGKILRKQKGRSRNKAERKAQPNRGGIVWEDVESGAYEKIKITDNGLIFPQLSSKEKRPAKA